MKSWIRLHTDLPTNRKAQALPGNLFKFWINCLALAGRSDHGYLPRAEDIAWELREKTGKVQAWLKELMEARLLIPIEGNMYQPHDWCERQFELSESALRVRRYRENKRLSVTGDLVVSEEESNAPEPVTVTHSNALQRRFSRASESVSVSVSESVSEKLRISPEEFESAWERHRKHARNEPKQLCLQHILGMNGSFDAEKFKERHGLYCEYWAKNGWQFCSLTFVGWVEAGMPLPPQVTATSKKRDEGLAALDEWAGSDE